MILRYRARSKQEYRFECTRRRRPEPSFANNKTGRFSLSVDWLRPMSQSHVVAEEEQRASHVLAQSSATMSASSASNTSAQGAEQSTRKHYRVLEFYSGIGGMVRYVGERTFADSHDAMRLRLISLSPSSKLYLNV